MLSKNINCSIENYFKDIQEEQYKVLFRGTKRCCLFSIEDPEILKYELNNNDTKLIYEKIKSKKLKFKRIKISNISYYDYNINLICKINNEYKELFIKFLNEELILIYKEGIVFNIKPNTKYIISNFSKSELGNNIITSEGNKYYVNKKIMGILEKYFECKDNKICCTYNNKEEIAKLTLVTEDEIITDNDIKILYQSLKLEINDKKFTFYINKAEYFDNKKEEEYYFSVLHVYNDNSAINDMICCYDFKKDKYYYLNSSLEYNISCCIDKRIYKKYDNGEKQDIYTYYLSKYDNKKFNNRLEDIDTSLFSSTEDSEDYYNSDELEEIIESYSMNLINNNSDIKEKELKNDEKNEKELNSSSTKNSDEYLNNNKNKNTDIDLRSDYMCIFIKVIKVEENFVVNIIKIKLDYLKSKLNYAKEIFDISLLKSHTKDEFNEEELNCKIKYDDSYTIKDDHDIKDNYYENTEDHIFTEDSIFYPYSNGTTDGDWW